jgi:hypothetical protein
MGLSGGRNRRFERSHYSRKLANSIEHSNTLHKTYAPLVSTTSSAIRAKRAWTGSKKISV